MMRRILVIEDNMDIRENISELLEIYGYYVLSAEDGEKGVIAAFSELPDLILCDVMMPKLDGKEVLKKLRNDPATKSIPFIYVTSSVEKKDVDLALDMGANGYIKKPFEEEELFAMIEQFLRRRV